MNIEMENVRKKIEPLIEKSLAGMKGGPISEALRADAELGMIFCIMLEFVNVTPRAEVKDVAVDENGTVHLDVPIPAMFKGYLDMRLQKLATGDQIHPKDTITVQA